MNGRVKKSPEQKGQPRQLDEATQERMRRFLAGELTWAEVEGMTYAQATAIARVGCDLAAQGRLTDARVIFEGLVAGNPKDSSAQAALGNLYQRLNRPEDALACYDKALAQFPEHVVALASRGELRLRQGDQAGLQDLVQAVEADPRGVTRSGKRARTLLAVLVQRAEEVKAAQARP